MKRATDMLMVLFLMASLSYLQGCASGNKQLVKKDISSFEPIKVCRYETPGIRKSTGTETAVLAAIEVGAPGGSALLVLGDVYEKLRGSGTQAKIPDFGFLVMDKFVEHIKSARPDWPPVTVVLTPLKEDFSEKCTVIEIKVNRVAYGSLDLTRGGIVLERGLDKGVISKGFLSKTTITMKDPQGEVLWEKSFIYLSENFGREMSFDVLEADNFMLLKEEMDFAAEQTVLDFIDHLNGEEPRESLLVTEELAVESLGDCAAVHLDRRPIFYLGTKLAYKIQD
jgi:hypothetical protein